MPAATPSAQTTLVVLLGASEWPYSPDFPQSQAFTNAARRLKEYFLHPQAFDLPSENLFDLFDSNHSADDIDREIGQFLEQRISRMMEAGIAARDLVVYFVGHGGFASGDAEYYLAIRRTRVENPTVSGIQIVSLAHTIKEKARYLRHIVILDCCFAAAAFRAFQATPEQVAITQTLEAFKTPGKGEGIPGRGTSLLCSSRHNRPSLLLPDGSSTMFSQALLQALVTGNPYRRHTSLSLRDVAGLAEDALHALAAEDAPRPEVHSPDQSEGDIAQLPFFPNLAARTARASFPNPGVQEERMRQVEEERQRQAEAERQKIETVSSTLPPSGSPRNANTEAVGLSETLPPSWPAHGAKVPHAPSVPETPFAVHFHASIPRKSPQWSVLVTFLCLVLLIVAGGGGIWFLVTQQNQQRAHFATATAIPARSATAFARSAAATATVAPLATATAAAKEYQASTARGVQFGFEAAHTRWNQHEQVINTANVTRTTLLWSYQTGKSIYSSPAVADGVVYVGSDDSKLYAFDTPCHNPCQPLWSYQTGSIVFSSPVVANGVVYVGSEDGKLYAFDASCHSACKPLWSYQTGGSIQSSPAVANGMVYVGSKDGKLYALGLSK